MYDPVLDGRRLTFGTSGWLYQSTVVLYDRRTESLWPQIDGVAISGKYRGTPLAKVAARDTTWGAWLAAHPDTLVLSEETGYGRVYGHDAYAWLGTRAGTRSRPRPTGFVTHEDGRHTWDTPVYGIEVAGVTKAYPVEALAHAPKVFRDHVGGQPIEIANDPVAGSFTAYEPNGQEILSHRMLWFAWAAHHPGTALFSGDEQAETHHTQDG